MGLDILRQLEMQCMFRSKISMQTLNGKRKCYIQLNMPPGHMQNLSEFIRLLTEMAGHQGCL